MTEEDADPQFAQGVFGQAADIVTTNTGPIVRRLNAAWMCFHKAFLHDMPTDECREVFMRIVEGLKGAEPSTEEEEEEAVSAVGATILAMSDERAGEIAQWVRELDSLLRGWCEANDPHQIQPHLPEEA
jgi:hypothetical protein